jgi:plastocyanin
MRCENSWMKTIAAVPDSKGFRLPSERLCCKNALLHGNMMGGSQQGTTATGITHMKMQNFAFQYAHMQVRAGTTMTWTNQDSAPHSVTFKNGMKDSGLLYQGQSFSYTFNSPGTYQYYCAVHPSTVATVTVTP